MKFREKYQESLVSTKEAFKDLGINTTYLNINYPAILFEVLNSTSSNKPCNYTTVAQSTSISYGSSHRLCRILAGKCPMADGSIIIHPLLQISNNNPVDINLTMQGRHFLAVVYDIFDDVKEDIPEPTPDIKEANRKKVSWLSRALGIK